MTTRDVKSDAARLLNTVAQGGVGIFATDVGYAIIGNGEAAIARIFACKRRNFDKACGMFSNWDMFDALAQVGQRERKIVDTVIYEHGLPLSVVPLYKIDHQLFSRLTPHTRPLSSRCGTVVLCIIVSAVLDYITPTA